MAKIHVIATSSGIALVRPIREMRPAVDAVLDLDGNEIVPAQAAETMQEYDSDIISNALSGFSATDNAVHVATMEEGDIEALTSGADFDIDVENSLVQMGIHKRAYRNELEWNGNELVIPALKKRAAILDKLRAVRNRALERSDAEILKAQEQGNAAAVDAWKTYRQTLRDLPQVWDGKLASVPTIWPVKPV